MPYKKILFTGGSGLLGSEFRKILPQINYHSSKDFNIMNYEQMDSYISKNHYSLLIHAAAFTSPPKIDENPLLAIDTNIIGTANVVKICMKYNIKLIYISTDYVFNGEKGNYKEEDPVYPINKYAWSKLGGECAVRLYDNSLIIRTSFGPNVFPYEKAFVDQWTSRESVEKIANMIAVLLDKDITGVVHVGGPRKTVFEYAKSLSPNKNIEPISIHEMNFTIPKDTSLNIERFEHITKKRIGEEK